MNNWQETLLRGESPIADAVVRVDTYGIALVVDEAGLLLGTITDSDIRRGQLLHLAMSEPCSKIMNAHPRVSNHGQPPAHARELMRRHTLFHIPIVDEAGCLTGMARIDEPWAARAEDQWIVLMAGGRGQRLRPLTVDTPKPMLKVGDKPLLESIIGNLCEQGFRRFYIAVNYKAEVVKDYFRDGADWGVEIRYLEETSEMGTAGALTLVPESQQQRLVVMNGDLLTKVNLHHMLNYHAEHKSEATMGVREYDFQVPFGVVNLEGHRIVGIDEKPVQRFMVNAGIYVVEPELIAAIPRGQPSDMTTLFERAIADGQTTSVFPIREYWLDVGRLDDFERAQTDFRKVFS
ncbi:MAG: nucleotidyltransferase family protein [Rhodospirillaceae bacterium]|nr:nucleotidyltransferase family protein [Rhodospirillales bacterium]